MIPLLRPIARAFGWLVVASLAFAATNARAATYATTFCVRITTAFTDNSVGDRWTSNGDVWARGVRLFVDAYTNNVFSAAKFDGYVSDSNGCTTVNLSSTQDHKVTVWSTAEVNGCRSSCTRRRACCTCTVGSSTQAPSRVATARPGWRPSTS